MRNTTYINEVTATQYSKLSTLASEIEEKLQELFLATVQADIPSDAQMKILKWLERAETFRGLSYFLTPQSEWVGGDSQDPKNFKIRAPHITA